MEFRSGFIALVGKPNVGKSTLVNSLVGSKVAITSKKPQTTRQRMLGIVHGPGYQAVLVDTPGMMVPKNRLHQKMVKAAEQEARDADLVLWLTEATHLPTDEDRAVAKKLSTSLGRETPVWLIHNKTDRSKGEEIYSAYAELCPQANRSYRISALNGQGVAELKTSLSEILPEGPPYFPEDQIREQNERLWLAEVIREQVLQVTRQEIPHAVAVSVEEFRAGEGDGDGLYARAILYVERSSQKGILIGKNGQLLKRIGSETRKELEAVWGRSLYLDLWVKVKEDWRDRDDWLRIFGYA